MCAQQEAEGPIVPLLQQQTQPEPPVHPRDLNSTSSCFVAADDVRAAAEKAQSPAAYAFFQGCPLVCVVCVGGLQECGQEMRRFSLEGAWPQPCLDILNAVTPRATL
mmetsp:Transcript_39998/g.87334  ORF Transcript_39998/g.87334 Transcript_39998/m.87334 type:complete len:107 (+) Transcript_39998:127-447(+)